MALSLRRLVVEEWLVGENSEDHQSFLTHASLQVEALQFLQPVVFPGGMVILSLKPLPTSYRQLFCLISALNLPVVVVMSRNAPLGRCSHLCGFQSAWSWSL